MLKPVIVKIFMLNFNTFIVNLTWGGCYLNILWINWYSTFLSPLPLSNCVKIKNVFPQSLSFKCVKIVSKCCMFAWIFHIKYLCYLLTYSFCVKLTKIWVNCFWDVRLCLIFPLCISGLSIWKLTEKVSCGTKTPTNRDAYRVTTGARSPINSLSGRPIFSIDTPPRRVHLLHLLRRTRSGFATFDG